MHAHRAAARAARLRLPSSAFIRLDDDLLAVAAEASPPLDETADDPGRLAVWVAKLSTAEKDRLLLRVVKDHGAAVRMEMLRRFRDETTPSIAGPARRTVADLLDGAAGKPAEYDAAVAFLTDLRALAERNVCLHEFAQRWAALRQNHVRKPSLLDRLDRANL